MRKWFDRALYVEPPVILGLRLRRFTLGHAWALDEVGSPYLLGESDTLTDLLIAVFICSQKPTEAKRDMSRWWARLYFYLWGLRCRKLSFVKERDRFLDYLTESMTAPEAIPPNAKDAKSLNAPFHWRLMAMLMVDFGMSKAEALEQDVGWAMCMWAVEGERQGKVELPSAQAVAFREMVDKLEGKEGGDGTD